MSYSDPQYEQYEEDYSFYTVEENDFELYNGSYVDKEPSYSISTQFKFRDDDGYSCDHLYNEYADRGTTPPRKDPLKEITWCRETCKTLPQQYQAYSVMMKSSTEVPFKFFVNSLFGYEPKNEDVELVKKGICPSCKRP